MGLQSALGDNKYLVIAALSHQDQLNVCSLSIFINLSVPFTPGVSLLKAHHHIP